MVQDVPATPAQIARHLGIKESTLATYCRTGNAPRAIQLALFWETRWGRSAADVDAANTAALYYRDAKATRRELERMAGVILALEKELAATSEGAANSPVFRVG
jgi:hypothetical protein